MKKSFVLSVLLINSFIVWSQQKQIVNVDAIKPQHPIALDSINRASDFPDASDYLLTKAKPKVIESDAGVITSIERTPEFPGGTTALLQYLSANLKKPAAAKKDKVHGRVIVQFVIDEHGNVTNSIIKHSLGFGCDEEVLRVVNGMPRWKPGIQNRIPVRVYYTLPVTFN